MKLDEFYRLDPLPEPTVTRGSVVYMVIPDVELELYQRQGWAYAAELKIAKAVLIWRKKRGNNKR